MLETEKAIIASLDSESDAALKGFKLASIAQVMCNDYLYFKIGNVGG